MGTWKIARASAASAVYEAIKLGYRHIDTAEAYRNEAQVGWAVQRAIKEGLVTRGELFIATKLSDESHAGYETTTAFVKEQLKLLQVEYVDLYMLHSPLSAQVSEKTHTSPQGTPILYFLPFSPVLSSALLCSPVLSSAPSPSPSPSQAFLASHHIPLTHLLPSFPTHPTTLRPHFAPTPLHPPQARLGAPSKTSSTSASSAPSA